MIKNYLLFVVLIASCQLFSQEAYLNTGKNFTKYYYKNSELQSNPNLQRGSGNFYEIGLAGPFISDHFLYSFALTLNEFNALGGSSANSYRWDTQYLGVKAGFAYSLFTEDRKSKRNFNFSLNAGLSGMTIIYGKQEMDGVYYDLMHNKEFTGLVLESSLGFQIKYAIPNSGFLSVGYGFSQSINISNTTAEKISFINQQIRFGVHFPIK